MQSHLEDSDRLDIRTSDPESGTIPPPPHPGLGIRYGQLIFRFRWLVIAFWAIAVVVSVPFSAQVTDHLSNGGFAMTGSESTHANTILGQKFTPALPSVVVVFQSTSTPVTDVTYQLQVLNFIPTVCQFTDVTRVTLPQGTQNLCATSLPNAIPATAIGQDGKSTYLSVDFNTSSDSAMNLMDSFHKILPTDGPARTYVTGDPQTYNDITVTTTSDLRQAEEVTLPIAAILLIFVFGTLISAAIPLGLAIVAIPITLALIFAISLHTEMSIYVVNIATIIGLGISIDYSLFIVRRFRDELRAGHQVRDAVAIAMSTSGEAILFSGLTVLIGFSALALIGIAFMTSLAIGGVIIVATAVLGALTLVPAVLGVLGQRVIATRIPRPWRHRNLHGHIPASERPGFWERVALFVMAHPVPVALGVLALLAVLAAPALSLRVGLPGITALPPDNPNRFGNTILNQQFPATQTSPVIVVVQTADGSPIMNATNIQQLCDLTARIAAIPHTQNTEGLVSNPQLTCAQYQALYTTGAYSQNPQLAQLVSGTTNGDTTLITVEPSAQIDTDNSRNVVTQLRALEGSSPLHISVTGEQAVSIDLANFLYGNFPRSLLFIFISTYIVLLIMFRSIFLPIKAVVMNVLSVAAAYGAMVWVFVQGHLSSQLHFSSEGFLEMTTPIILFCVLFGLSMDYEVFLLSRIREEFVKTGDNRHAVAYGVQKTAGVITSAALIIVVVSGAFIFTQLTLTKELGVGLVVAIAVDATIIRLLLVPATMRLLGRWNWWFPGRSSGPRAQQTMGGEA